MPLTTAAAAKLEAIARAGDDQSSASPLVFPGIASRTAGFVGLCASRPACRTGPGMIFAALPRRVWRASAFRGNTLRRR